MIKPKPEFSVILNIDGTAGIGGIIESIRKAIQNRTGES